MPISIKFEGNISEYNLVHLSYLWHRDYFNIHNSIYYYHAVNIESLPALKIWKFNFQHNFLNIYQH